MNLRSRFACLPLAVSMLTGSTLRAENLNVSPIAIAGRNLDWAEEAGAPRERGGATYMFYQMGRARVLSDATDYFAPGPWGAAWQTSPSYPAFSRHVDTVPTPQLAWASPYYRLAKVDMASFPKRVESRAFSSGWAMSAVNYSVRVDHYSSTPLDYFVLLNHPKFLRGIQPAQTLQQGGPGGAGGTYLPYSPDAARSRSAVDVLVDGLPVWSSESTYMYPEGAAGSPSARRETWWGNAVLPDGQTKLYLGRLQAGKAITITFVVRTDAHVDADFCGTQPGGWNLPNEKHCFDLAETVELTSLATGPVSFSVYGKELHTTPMLLSAPYYGSPF